MASTLPVMCYRCGAGRLPLERFKFGLVRLTTNKLDWESTAASVFLSAISIPLMGMGGMQLPGRNMSGHLLRLDMLLCQDCKKDTRKSVCVTHPLWAELHQLGFTHFVSVNDLDKWSGGTELVAPHDPNKEFRAPFIDENFSPMFWIFMLIIGLILIFALSQIVHP